MPKISDVNLERVFMALPRKFDWVCECHKHDLPPFTGEIHGMSQALNSKNIKQRIFWWTVVLICITGGTSMVVMVILEYIQGPTATSTTIRLVGEIIQIFQKLFKKCKIYLISRQFGIKII